MNQKYVEAIKIAEDIKKDIYSKDHLIPIVQKYYSLVGLLKYEQEEKWVKGELYGYRSPKDVPKYRIFTSEQNYSMYVLYNLDQIDHRVTNGISSYHYVYHNGKKYNKRLANPGIYKHVLYIVRNIIHERTLNILYNLKFDTINNDVFQEIQDFVNTRIKELNPGLFEDLGKIYQDLNDSDNSTDWQTVSYQCRLVLQNFANMILEANDKKHTGFDGKSHPIGEDNYVNRITAYIEQNVDSKSEKEFLKSHVLYLHSFLENLYKLTNKGSHKKIERENANRCVIYTYLIIGDILNITSN